MRKRHSMVIRILALIAAAILIVPSVSACLNPIGIDECAYVVAIGADLGTEKKYELTFVVQRESTGDTTGDNGGAIILSAEGDNIFDAVNELSPGVDHQLNFTRTHAIIFGEALARKGLIDDFTDVSLDVLRIRTSAFLVVTRCSVREYIGGLAANDEPNLAKMLDDIISDVRITGRIAAINLAGYFEASEGRFDAVMPLGYYDGSIITDTAEKDSAKQGRDPIKDAEAGERIGGMQSLTKGAALFDGGTMTGVLDEEETLFMNMVRGEFRQGTIDFEQDGRKASIYLVLKKRKITAERTGNAMAFTVRLRLGVTVKYDAGIGIGENWNESEKEAIAAYIKSELMRVLEKCKASGCDAMGLGRYASMLFSDTDEFYGFDWKSRYPDCAVRFETELDLDDEYIAGTGS